LPGGPEPALARRQARARRDRAGRAPGARVARPPDEARPPLLRPGRMGRGVSRRNGKQLRVVHCPMNTAGVPWQNVQALRRHGVDAKLVVFERYRLHPEADWSLERSGGFFRRQLAQWKAFIQLLPQTDVFHFYFGLTLVP